MANIFFNAIQKLMPDGYRNPMHIDSNVRRLFMAIAVLPDDIRKELQGVYMDLFVDVTRGLDDWERVFGVLFTLRELELRRKVLAALWQMNGGGQSWEFLQMVLRLVVPEISVVENVPVRDPRPYQSAVQGFICGGKISCGNENAVCGFQTLDGISQAILINNKGKYYTDISVDSWPFYFFVCKKIKRDDQQRILSVEALQIPDIYKNFVEYFILKIKPVQSRAVMYVEWV